MRQLLKGRLGFSILRALAGRRGLPVLPTVQIATITVVKIITPYKGRNKLTTRCFLDGDNRAFVSSNANHRPVDISITPLFQVVEISNSSCKIHFDWLPTINKQQLGHQEWGLR